MLKFSYKCACGHTHCLECKRGQAPKTIECSKCGADMERMINVVDPANISAPDGAVNPRESTLRKNLKERQKKVSALSEAEKKRFDEWSKKNSGGRW